jgi:hypothetical protein
VQPENLAYALTQVVHNFGAAALIGASVFWLWPAPRRDHARTFAWAILAAWSAQIASGILFGLTSLYYYGETPDLSAVAMTALVIKVCSAAAGFLLGAWFLARGRDWSLGDVKRVFQTQFALAGLALTGAAFLRWFS